jgi:hypothetical protein
MLVEVLQPLETHLVIYLSILGCGNSPIGQEAASFVPVTKVMLTYNYSEWQDGPACRIDLFNYCNPFPISRLY